MLHQQRTGWVDLENGRFLLTFSTFFTDVGGSEIVQKNADVINGWSLSKLQN